MTPKTKEIAESIARDRAALLASVEGSSPAQADFRPGPDAWSISDVLHHLALSEEASAKLMAIFLDRATKEGVGPDPSPGDSVLRSLEARIGEAAGRKAVAPDRVTPRSKIEPAVALERLAAGRKRLLETLAQLSAFDGTKLTFPHPFFGDFNLYQWALLSGWHERRHTGQIEKIKASPGFPSV
jgi:hypothetical protein